MLFLHQMWYFLYFSLLYVSQNKLVDLKSISSSILFIKLNHLLHFMWSFACLVIRKLFLMFSSRIPDHRLAGFLNEMSQFYCHSGCLNHTLYIFISNYRLRVEHLTQYMKLFWEVSFLIESDKKLVVLWEWHYWVKEDSVLWCRQNPYNFN